MTPLFDAGAQLERTSLAWVRTALALIATGALCARFGLRAGEPILGGAIAVLAITTGLVTGLSATGTYERRQADLDAARPIVAPSRLLCVSATLTLTSCAAFVLVLHA